MSFWFLPHLKDKEGYLGFKISVLDKVGNERQVEFVDDGKIGTYLAVSHYKINFDILYAPGSFEIPFIINKNINLYDGFVALGCIIRGETIHFELIANECARKIMDLSIISKKPIGFGIITCENIKQAIKRSKFDSHGINKGQEAAYACAKLLYPEKLRHHNKDFIL